MSEIWFSDAECFKYDWLFCFKNQTTGERRAFWNEDVTELVTFLEEETPILCGYNFRAYDSNLLKGILLGWSPLHINELSQVIVTHDDLQDMFDMFANEPFVTLPSVIDLLHDIVPRKGLKEIEGNIGISIEESSVSFDIDRPLSEDERKEVLHYCWHDVDATETLYGLRTSYLQSKVTLCDMCGLGAANMLKHTNARIVAEALGAQSYLPPYETYEIPGNVDTSVIPPEVLSFVEAVDTDNCEEKGNKCLFEFHGCPTVVGFGGIHGAVPAYREASDEDRVILHQDVNSYYPSLIIQNGYMSRGVPEWGVARYKEFYDMRIEAKKNRDTDSANAAKLVLNTVYGTFKSQYSKLYDPMMSTRICFAGELYLLMLVAYISVIPSVKIIQLNTDGIFISVDRKDLNEELAIVAEWEKTTKMTIGNDEIESIIQRDVNNYVIRYADGKIETKGGTVGNYGGGDFKSNSMTIVDKAIGDYLLDGVPIEQTITSCDDLSRFQIIAKAGSGYRKVYSAKEIVERKQNPKTGRMRTERHWAVGEEVNRVNRIYATKDETKGTLLKEKVVNGKASQARIPKLPDHCQLDNGAALSTDFLLTELDKQWYIDYAKKQTKAFMTEEGEMEDEAEVKVETQEETKPVRRRQRKEETVAEDKVQNETPVKMTFNEKLLALQAAMSGASDKVAFDKAVGTKFDYADTQQYKRLLANKATEVGLVFSVDFGVYEFLGVVNQVNGNLEGTSLMYGGIVRGLATLSDAAGSDRQTNDILGMGTSTTPGYVFGAAQTNALRSYIFNNFLVDNMGRDGDDMALMGGEFDKKTNAKTYVKPEQKPAMVENIIANKGEQMVTVMYAEELYSTIQEAMKVDPGFKATKLLNECYEDGKPIVGKDGNSVIEKTRANRAMERAEQVIAAKED